MDGFIATMGHTLVIGSSKVGRFFTYNMWKLRVTLSLPALGESGGEKGSMDEATVLLSYTVCTFMRYSIASILQ